jgi:hypothetical protein
MERSESCFCCGGQCSVVYDNGEDDGDDNNNVEGGVGSSGRGRRLRRR